MYIMSVTTESAAPSSRLILAVQIINKLDDGMLSKIMKRVCQEFHMSLQSQQTFTHEEMLKLQESLSLNGEQLNSMLRCASYIIQQASFHLMKPSVFTEYLKGLGLNDHSAATISDIWSGQAKPIVESLKKKTVCATKVESVESSVNCQLSSLSGGRVKKPVGLIHLNLMVDSGTKESSTTLSLEFTKEELTCFYETLETIQNQLDNIV